MYVQRIFLGINPRVIKYHAFIFNRATTRRRETRRRRLVVDQRKWLATSKTGPKPSDKTVRIARAHLSTMQVEMEMDRDRMETMRGNPLIMMGTVAQNREGIDLLLEGGVEEAGHPRTRIRRGRWDIWKIPGPMRAQGSSRTPGTRRTLGTPRTNGTQGNLRTTVLHRTGEHDPTIPGGEHYSSGKFAAVCRRIPISVDANSAKRKPEYGRTSKFNSGGAGCGDPCTTQVGRKYPPMRV